MKYLERVSESWCILSAYFKDAEASVSRQLLASVALLTMGMLSAAVLPAIAMALMGQNEYGRLEFSTSLATLVALIAPLGLDAFVLRSNSISLKAGMPAQGRRLVIFGVAVATGVAVAIGIGLAFSDKFQHSAGLGYLYIPLLTLAACAFFLSFCVQATYSRVLGAALRNPLFTSLAMMFWLFLSSFFMSEIRAEHAIAATLFVYLLSTIIAASIIFQKIDRKKQPATHTPAPLSSILRVSFPMLVFSSSFLIINQTDIIMVGYLLTSKDVGTFAFASKLASLTSLGLLAVNVILPPLIAVQIKEGLRSELQASLTAFGSFASAAYVACVIAIAFTAIPLSKLAGLSNSEWMPCLIILLLGQFFNVFTGSCGYLLTMSGHQNIAAKTTAIAAIANLVLNLFLIPSLGIMGAAISTSLAVGISNIYMAHKAGALTGFHSSILMAGR